VTSSDRTMSPARPTNRGSTVLYRLRHELDLAILSIFGGSAAIVIVVFSGYRFIAGQVIGGVVDLGIALALGAVVFYAWIGNVTRAGEIFVVLAVIACIASSIVFGRTATYWTYLVLSISFILAGVRVAMITDLVLIAAIAPQPLFDNHPERAIFIVTALLIMVYGWIYSVRYESQRRKLEQMATMDPLTGAGNRRVMSDQLAEAATQGSPAAVVVLDLDHFKEINDRHGHTVGDQVLVELADFVRARLREAEAFYRLGGEEFVILTPDTELDRVHERVDAMRREFKELMRSYAPAATISIGVAALRPGEDPSAWLKRADEALYRAKQAGRDRVVIDAPD